MAGITRTMAVVLIVAALACPAHADQHFNDGAVHEFGGTEIGALFVSDGPGDAPTSLNINAGAQAAGASVSDWSIINVYGGTLSGDLSAYDDAAVAVMGGSMNDLDALGRSWVHVFGGTFTGGFEAYDQAELHIYAFTSCAEAPAAYTDSMINILGGTFDRGAHAYGNAVINIRGGNFDTDGVGADPLTTWTPNGHINFFGSSFALNGIGVADGTVLTQGGRLTGTLSGGQALDVDLAYYDGGFGINVPEPATAALVALGLAALARRRQGLSGDI